MLRPYSMGRNDAMDMVGHEDEGIQFNVREMLGQLGPTGLNGLAEGVHLHLIPNDLAEKAFSPVGANCDEICAGPGIVVSGGLNGLRLLTSVLHVSMVFSAPAEAGQNPGSFPA